MFEQRSQWNQGFRKVGDIENKKQLSNIYFIAIVFSLNCPTVQMKLLNSLLLYFFEIMKQMIRNSEKISYMRKFSML